MSMETIHTTIDPQAALERQERENLFISFGRHAAWKREAAEILRERVPEQGGRAIDLCCGTGDMALLLCEGGGFSVVVGVDAAPDMLHTAGVRAVARESQGLQAPVFIPGNAMRLPFADEEVDVAAVSFGLSAVAEPERALSELYRVLRPGAAIAVLDSCRPSGSVQRCAAAVQFGPAARLFFGGDKAERLARREALEGFFTPEELRDAMQSAGFEQLMLRKFLFGGGALVWGTKPRESAGVQTATCA